MVTIVMTVKMPWKKLNKNRLNILIQKVKKMMSTLTPSRMPMRIIWSRLENCLLRLNRKLVRYSTKSNHLMKSTVNLMKNQWKTTLMTTYVSYSMKSHWWLGIRLSQNMKTYSYLRQSSIKRRGKRSYQGVHHLRNQTNLSAWTTLPISKPRDSSQTWPSSNNSVYRFVSS